MAGCCGYETLRHAILITKTGGRLYENLANRSENPLVVRAFGMFSADEFKHQKIFENLLENLTEEQNEAFEALAPQFTPFKDRIFEEAENLHEFKNSQPIEEILELLIQIEAEACALFQRFLPALDAGDRHKVEDIIEDNRRQMQQMFKLRSSCIEQNCPQKKSAESLQRRSKKINFA